MAQLLAVARPVRRHRREPLPLGVVHADGPRLRVVLLAPDLRHGAVGVGGLVAADPHVVRPHLQRRDRLVAPAPLCLAHGPPALTTDRIRANPLAVAALRVTLGESHTGHHRRDGSDRCDAVLEKTHCC